MRFRCMIYLGLPFLWQSLLSGLCEGFLTSSGYNPRSYFHSCAIIHRKIALNTNLFERNDDDKNQKKNDKSIHDLNMSEKLRNKRPRNIIDEGDIRGPDRIKSCIPYTLVLIDGDSFGKYIYERIPPLGTLDYVFIRPIVELVHAVPVLSIVFFAMFALGPRFTNQSREVRFNSQQAVFLDVALLFPSLIGEAIQDEHLPRSLLEPATNFVWYVYMSAVVYCVSCNLRGKKPDQIPYISNAAEYSIGPF